MNDLVFLVISVIAIVFGLVTWFQEKQIKNWSSTIGKINWINISEVKIDFQKHFRLELEYRFQAVNKEFISNQINLGGGMDEPINKQSMEKYQHLADKYAQGKEVIVYYNPKDPQQSVLEKSSNTVIAISLIFGFIGVIVWLAFFAKNWI